MAGKDKDKKDEKVTGTEAYANAPTTQTFQPFLPGFDGAIAQQLAQGFGGQTGMAPADYQTMLAGMYQPMSVMKFNEPISTTAAFFDPKKNAAIDTGNPALDKLLMGQNWPKEKKK